MFKLKDVKLNQGATLDRNGNPLNYTRGYQVSERDLEIIPEYKLTKKLLLKVLNTLDNNKCLGIWIENKKVYIDISEYISTKREAIKQGKARKQISIFSWKNSEAIYC